MPGTRDRFGASRTGSLWHSPAAERNLAPILDVLGEVLGGSATRPGDVRPAPASGTVLEIASGSGQHIVAFAERFPQYVWQPSEIDRSMRASIRERAADSAATNLREPLALDAFGSWDAIRAADPDPPIDVVLAINLVHIASWADAGRLLANAVNLLAPAGVLYLYGPYRRDGAHTSEGNRRFDAVLRERNPDWGIRDLEAMVEAAGAAGFAAPRVVDMPANNLSLIFRKPPG